jgi:hypothetical protein
VLGDTYINQEREGPKPPFPFNTLNFIPIYLQTPFFILFIIGGVFSLIELGIGYDLIKRNKKLKSHILIILILVAIYSFFIFYVRSAAEDRWLLPSALSLAIIAGYGGEKVYNFVKPYGKIIAIILVVGVLFYGANGQIKQADNIIKGKMNSFLQMRQGFDWIKFNTPQDSIIGGNSIAPYVSYYSQREYRNPVNATDMDNSNSDYFVLQLFTQPGEWVQPYLQEHQEQWQVINIIFFDENQQQPAFIIYKRI